MRVASKLRELGLTFAAAQIDGVQLREMSETERALWRVRVDGLRDAYKVVPVTSQPEVAALHTAYSALGIGLRHGRPSIERLGGMLAKGRDMPVINIVADLYNLASLEHSLCMGAHDLDLLELPIDLRLTTGAESFAPLGGQSEPVRPGEFAYVDAANRIICRLDAVQADFSKVTASTTNVLLIVEASSVTPEAKLLEITANVACEIALATQGKAHASLLATPTSF